MKKYMRSIRTIGFRPPLFTSCREGGFSETEFPLLGFLRKPVRRRRLDHRYFFSTLRQEGEAQRLLARGAAGWR